MSHELLYSPHEEGEDEEEREVAHSRPASRGEGPPSDIAHILDRLVTITTDLGDRMSGLDNRLSHVSTSLNDRLTHVSTSMSSQLGDVTARVDRRLIHLSTSLNEQLHELSQRQSEAEEVLSEVVGDSCNRTTQELAGNGGLVRDKPVAGCSNPEGQWSTLVAPKSTAGNPFKPLATLSTVDGDEGRPGVEASAGLGLPRRSTRLSYKPRIDYRNFLEAGPPSSWPPSEYYASLREEQEEDLSHTMQPQPTFRSIGDRGASEVPPDRAQLRHERREGEQVSRVSPYDDAEAGDFIAQSNNPYRASTTAVHRGLHLSKYGLAAMSKQRNQHLI